MTDEKITAVTALTLANCILAELTVRLGPDFARAVETRMNSEVDRRTDNGNAYDAQDAQALLEGMEMIEWHQVTG